VEIRKTRTEKQREDSREEAVDLGEGRKEGRGAGNRCCCRSRQRRSGGCVGPWLGGREMGRNLKWSQPEPFQKLPGGHPKPVRTAAVLLLMVLFPPFIIAPIY
jgi:hypothetical protein